MDDSILEGNLCDVEQQIDAEFENTTNVDNDNIYTEYTETIECTDSVESMNNEAICEELHEDSMNAGSDGMDGMTDINKDSDDINVTYDEGIGQKEDIKTTQNIDNNEVKMEDVLASLTPEQVRQLYIKQMEQTQNMNM
ncbi:MAG: hypothetical protein K6G26_02040, partial [Lachnospiraceae bacterium]|nr:hypothetical protein [Lachnospiraceae bacterium]